MVPDSVYALGHAPHEVRRLECQADILLSPTLRLLCDCGLRPGMRVLDVGTGAGDVAMLAAASVGESGSVVGIDRNDAVLARARTRAEQARLPQVRFEQLELTQACRLGSFDLVICRFVLMHQPDPVGFLREAAVLAGETGCVALLEMASRKEHCFSAPPLELYDTIISDIFDAFALAGSDLAVGLRLVHLFAAAGLAEPHLRSEAPVGGPASSIAEWLVQTWISMRPVLAKAGRPSPLDPDTLFDRLRTAMLDNCAQVLGPVNVAAWAAAKRSVPGD